MKIAIQGHPTRGKEVIQILESLGGINTEKLEGVYKTFYYIDNKNEISDDHKDNFSPTYRLYTLDEFEKEFPFKIGDKVTIIGLPDFPKVITQMVWDCSEILYSFEGLNNTWFGAKSLKKFEMKEERNITLTLDKAKEWYKKGGELREVALQAFTEMELNPLPRSWKEFCEIFPVKSGECFLEPDDEIGTTLRDCSKRRYKTWIPSRKSAEAHLAMIQLEQLRDCYNNSCNDISRIAIINNNGNIELYVDPPFNCFLTFKNHLLAREFFSNFKEIIEIAKELI